MAISPTCTGKAPFDCGERVLGFRAIRSAGLRHIGAPATTLAAKRFRARADEIDGADALGQIVGDPDNERSPPIVDRDKCHDTGAKLRLRIVGKTLEVF